MNITVREIPGTWGRPVGRYTLRLGDRTKKFPRGVRFVNGVTVEPVDGRAARRLFSAYGRRGLTIEPADEATVKLVAQYLRYQGKVARADELDGVPHIKTPARVTSPKKAPPKSAPRTETGTFAPKKAKRPTQKKE